MELSIGHNHLQSSRSVKIYPYYNCYTFLLSEFETKFTVKNKAISSLDIRGVARMSRACAPRISVTAVKPGR